MSFTATTDYTGFWKIGKTNHVSNDLQEYIDNGEPEKLRDLLGCELYDLFIADFAITGTEPTEQRFKDIFDPFCMDDGNTNGLQHRSEGMKAMLKGFVYNEYVKDTDFANVISGNVKNNFSNSAQARSVEYGITERYNRSVCTYQEIQWFIRDNSSTYPEFNGICKDVVSWLD